MGNAPSAQEGRSARLSKTSKSKESSPEPSTLPKGTLLNAQRGQHASIASVLQELNGSQSTLRQVRSDERSRTSGNDLQHSASNESFAHFVTPQASRSQLVSPANVSVGFDPKQIDVKAALAILEELRKTASPEELVALHRALLPLRPAAGAEDATDTANLVRHDSFASPNTPPKNATGLPVVGRKPVARSTSWKPEMLGASPLSKLEKLGKQNSDDQDALLPPRATTPADMEHIGAMKLGTLVVTNGVPGSPGASVAETARTQTKVLSDKRHDEEYFTAEESEEEVPLELRARDLESLKVKREDIFGGPLRIDTAAAQSDSTVTVDSNSTLRPIRTGSPLKNQISRDSSVKSAITEQSRSSPETSSELNDSNVEKQSSLKQQKPSRKRLSKAEPVKTSTTRLRDLVGDEFDDSDPEPEPEAVPVPVLSSNSYHSRHHSNVSAAELASEYQAGLPDSPFSPVSPIQADFPDSSTADVGVAAANDPLQSSLGDEDLSMTARSASSEPPPESLRGDSPTDPELINPYAPWHSRAVTRRTALGSHPVVPSEQSSLSSTANELSVRPTASSRPSQQSDSGYSTASRNGQLKSPMETFAQTRLEPEDATNETMSSRDTSPFEPVLHHSMLGTDEDQAAPLTNAMEPRQPLTTQSSTVSSVIYSPMENSEVKNSELTKSWRTSRLRLTRLLLSDSSSSKDRSTSSIRVPAEDSTAVEKSTKGARTPKKKLQKKRPNSDMPAPNLALSIPDIPAVMATKFGDRVDIFDHFDGSHAPADRRATLTTAHAVITNDLALTRTLSNPEPPQACTAPVEEPRHPSRAPPPLPRSATVIEHGPQQRRSSLTRFLRPKSIVMDDSYQSQPDDGHDAYPYNPEFASMVSITQSLGASPYDHAKPKLAPARNDLSNEHILPFPRAQRRKVQGRRRPKSYHGRSVARKMEMVGEESVEDIGYDDMMSARHNQRPSMESARSEHEQQHNRPRPRSFGQAEAKRYIPYRDPSVANPPLPALPIHNKPSWSGPLDTWRQNRELASRNVQQHYNHNQTEQQSSAANLGTMVMGGPSLSPIDLPTISAKPRPRPQTQQRQSMQLPYQPFPKAQEFHQFRDVDPSLRRPRPLSTLVPTKSQPDMRAQARFYAESRFEPGKAQAIYQYPAASPSASVLTKKQAWMMAGHEV